MTPNLFRFLALGRILDHHPVRALDIGSRGGFERDLDAIAFAIDALGFEPEADAFAQLDGNAPSPWRSLTFLPVAIGPEDGERRLYIARDPGSTSLLEPDTRIGEAFAKPQFFDVVATPAIACRNLDSILAETGIGQPAYLKIDVEGAELEILQSSPATLSSLLALKVEVGFRRFRLGQPVASEIESFLREQGFELLDFTGPARWRIDGYVIHPQADKGAIPYSRGQLMHGDYIFLRDPNTIREPERLFQLAALAMAHGFFDPGLAILSRPAVAAWLNQTYNMQAQPIVSEASRIYGRVAWRRAFIRHLRLLVTFGRSAVNLFLG